MAGFIESAAEGAFGVVMDRVRRGVDIENPRPDMDLHQQRELQAQQADGRKAEAYQQALEHHGFRWWPAEALGRVLGQPVAAGTWRHERGGWAFTEHDLVSLFPGGPESLDAWIREQKLIKRAARVRAPKSELRKALRK